MFICQCCREHCDNTICSGCLPFQTFMNIICLNGEHHMRFRNVLFFWARTEDIFQNSYGHPLMNLYWKLRLMQWDLSTAETRKSKMRKVNSHIFQIERIFEGSHERLNISFTDYQKWAKGKFYTES